MFRNAWYSEAETFSLRLLTAALLCVLLFLPGCKEKTNQSVSIRTETHVADVAPRAAFVSGELCAGCHEEQYMEWTGSRHDLSMDRATDGTVRGDFENVLFAYKDEAFILFRDGDKYTLRTAGQGSEVHGYGISYVMGASPVQQYVIEFPDGRMQVPGIAWDSRPLNREGGRWIRLYSGKSGHMAGVGGQVDGFLNWNSLCGDCHTTNFRKNYDLKTDTFKSAWSMIDVGCQACHGPGSNHVEWARSRGGTEGDESDNGDMGLAVKLGADDPRSLVEACARCHSSRLKLQKEYEYGKPFMDSYAPNVLTYPLYYPDGQIRDEAFVYGSYVQSKKYARGITCIDCHNPHTAMLRSYGNDLCVDCHSSPPAQQFSYLKDKDYNSPLHHFHKENSPGSLCVACHMPETPFMTADSHRDHSFQIPRPDLSIRLNIPNACNRCHADKSARWADKKIYEVHPISRRAHEMEEGFADVFSAGEEKKPEAEAGLIGIAGNGSLPAVIRATALNILSGYRSGKAAGITALCLVDEDPLVRYESVKGISAMISRTADAGDQQKKYSLLAPLLKDPVRAVRIVSARAVAEVPREIHDSANSHDFEQALEEYKEQLEYDAERPESHMRFGDLYQDLGQYDQAVESYETAFRLDDGFYPARYKLAELYKRTGSDAEAEQQYREIIRRDPEQARAYYLLGRMFSEEDRLDEAASLFGKAVEYMPGDASARYDYALTLRHLGRNEEALSEMLHAHDLDPKAPSVVQALAIFYIQDKQWEKALHFTELLIQLAPDAERPKHMLKQIQKVMREGEAAIE